MERFRFPIRSTETISMYVSSLLGGVMNPKDQQIARQWAGWLLMASLTTLSFLYGEINFLWRAFMDAGNVPEDNEGEVTSPLVPTIVVESAPVPCFDVLSVFAYDPAEALSSEWGEYGLPSPVECLAWIESKSKEQGGDLVTEPKKDKPKKKGKGTMTPKLTAKQFGMGYVEKWDDDEGVFGDRLTLSKENGAFMVKGFIGGKHIVEGCRTLTEARKLFARYKKESLSRS